jgi:ubiquinone/menaquinone biosynthesis C-methylase UbiE
MVGETAYDVWHEQFGVDTSASDPWSRLVRDHLDERRDLKGKKVLEIGCGRGGFSCFLAKRPDAPLRLCAADISHTAIRKGHEFAQASELRSIDWLQTDIEKIPFPSETFDTVFSCETIEHVPSPKVAICELARVLKPGGRLFVSAPNYMGTLGLYRGYMFMTGRRFTELGQPINNFLLLPLVTQWVRAAGLRIERVDAVGHYLPFPGRPAIRLEVLDNPRPIMKWFGNHSLIVAVKE